jgi:hypothetical protein
MYDQRSRKIRRRKKLLAALIAAFILGNLVLVSPAFASTDGQHAPAGAQICWPFWPFCWKTPTPTPTPTSTPTPTPTPGHTGTPGPRPTGTPSGTPSATPSATPSPTPSPTGPPIHLAAATSFTMTATQIVGTNAHLSLAPDPLHPVLTFASVTIQGMKITHLSFVLSASGTVTGSGVAIKTSVFQEFVSALVSFTDKADLLVLLAGGTVPTLTMRNVSLQIDRYIDMQSLTIVGLHLTY